jgi:hypothetical protein
MACTLANRMKEVNLYMFYDECLALIINNTMNAKMFFLVGLLITQLPVPASYNSIQNQKNPCAMIRQFSVTIKNLQL